MIYAIQRLLKNQLILFNDFKTREKIIACHFHTLRATNLQNVIDIKMFMTNESSETAIYEQ